VYRFLLTRRWLALAVVAVTVAVVCARLGWWQFERLGEQRAANAVVVANLDAGTVPARREMSVGESPEPDQEWRSVSMTGRYAAEAAVLLRYQTHAGRRGAARSLGQPRP